MNRQAYGGRSRLSLIVAFTVFGTLLTGIMPFADGSEWVTRDKRWYIRGPWNWAIPRELPELFREFNGIDFGHAHLAETLIRTQDQQRVEQARLEVLDFIFSSPPVPPDEEQVAPTLVRMTWEVQRAFNWAHTSTVTCMTSLPATGCKTKKVRIARYSQSTF
jgi:hypothetical protein